MSCQLNEAVRSQSNIEFIKQTADPKDYKKRPAPVAHPVAMEQRVSLNTNFFVAEQPPKAPADEGISNKEGMVLWFPKDGFNSFYHMGIVPKGIDSTAIRAGNNMQNSITWWSGAYAQGTGNIIYEKALTLPRLYDGGRIHLAPKLEDKFSLCRVYGGMLEMWSSTTSTTSTAINGVISTAVVSNTRDISQTADGTECYAVVDLEQSARTQKEIIKEVNIATGVISLQGPDISATYTPPDKVLVDQINGGWDSSFTLNDGSVAQLSAPFTTAAIDMNPGVTLGGGTQIPLVMCFASPFGVCAQEVGAPLIDGYGGLNVPCLGFSPINETGYCDVRVTGTFYDETPYDEIYDVNVTMRVETIVEHTFAYIDDGLKGTIAYNYIHTKDVRDMPLICMQPSTHPAPLSHLSQVGVSIDHTSEITDQISARGGMNGLGKWVGAKISVILCSRDNNKTPAVAIANPRSFTFAQGVDISVRARQLYVEGKLGPMHIMRYDQVGADQNIRLTGCLNTEVVARGDIAPFIQEKVTNTDIACDTNVYPMLYALYNSTSTPFKCSWVRQLWAEFIKDYVSSLSPEKLQDVADRDPVFKGAGEAAGLFGGLGGLAGQGIGALMGNSQLGQQLGTSVGGLADSFSGAMGQFGSSQSNAMGQFGIPNNSYSGASGMFGAR